MYQGNILIVFPFQLVGIIAVMLCDTTTVVSQKIKKLNKMMKIMGDSNEITEVIRVTIENATIAIIATATAAVNGIAVVTVTAAR